MSATDIINLLYQRCILSLLKHEDIQGSRLWEFVCITFCFGFFLQIVIFYNDTTNQQGHLWRSRPSPQTITVHDGMCGWTTGSWYAGWSVGGAVLTPRRFRGTHNASDKNLRSSWWRAWVRWHMQRYYLLSLSAREPQPLPQQKDLLKNCWARFTFIWQFVSTLWGHFIRNSTGMQMQSSHSQWKTSISIFFFFKVT